MRAMRGRRVEIPGPDLLRKDRVIQMLPNGRHHVYSMLPPCRTRAGLNNFPILQTQMTETPINNLKQYSFEHWKIGTLNLFRIY